MLPDIINRLSFDFTCRSEETAGKVQHDWQYFTSEHIQHIIHKIVARRGQPNHYHRIDKIEINLGDILLSQLSEDVILQKFERELDDKLNHFNYETNHISGQKNHIDSDWDIVAMFLLHGDLPWWVDKRSAPDISKMLQKQLSKNADKVISFFKQHKTHIALKERLQLLVRSDVKHTQRLQNFLSSNAITPKHIVVSNEEISGLEFSAFKESSDRKKIEKILAKKLRTQPSHLWIHKLEMLISLSGKDKSEIDLLNFSEKSAVKKLRQLLKQLTVFQLAFLASIDTSIPKAHLEKRGDEKLIRNLSKKIDSGNRSVEAMLTSFSQPELQTLFKCFRELEKGIRDHKKQVRSILHHPNFARYEVINLLLNSRLSIAATEDRFIIGNTLVTVWNLTRQRLTKALKALTNKYSKGRSARAKYLNEGILSKRLARELLTALPLNSLALISSLLQLDEKKIEELIRSQVDDANSSTKTTKTIIENAGLSLLAAYLPALFSELGYTINNQFKSKEKALRSACLLQYIVTGKRVYPEYLLPFNKLLCGLDPNDAITVRPRFNKRELTEANHLMEAVIKNWNALKNTSVEGLRNSFLQRKGILTETGESWTLQVEKKGFDVLLNSLQWTFNTIRLPWMKKWVAVEW